jgi:hypothetical protein
VSDGNAAGVPLDHAKLEEIVGRAYTDSAFRGAIIYFPERVIAEYELGPAEAYVVETGDLSRVDFGDDLLMDRARWVWDLTHMAGGE